MSNSVPCCANCNYAKHDLTLELFQKWIDRLVSFQNPESGAKSIGENQHGILPTHAF
jgi:hypothetical protein